MCKIIIPNLENINIIGREIDTIKSWCKNQYPAMYHSYECLPFVDGTGYVERVYQEIDFVLSSNFGNTFIKNADHFIEYWKLEKYRDYKLSELSGGWKKYLGLALFTNIIFEGKIYFDAFRQLSDRLILILINNLKETPTEYSYFIEYDVNLFPKNIEVKKTNFGILNEQDVLMDKPDFINETNY